MLLKVVVHSPYVVVRTGWELRQAFFDTFMVAGVVGHYRFVEFWSQKAWVFSQNAWVFSPEPLSFFQSTGILKIWSQIFGKMAVFCRKFAQKVPNIAFLGALRANLPGFGPFLAKLQKMEWVLKFTWLLSLPVRWVLAWKIVESFGLLSFFGLEFFQKCSKSLW